MNRTGSSIARGIVCAATILSCASVLWGVEFAGGTGEPNNPYQIATAEQLIAIGSAPNLGQKDFVLVADIDLSFPVWSEPVIPVFGGTLDGNGHAIQGLVARGVEPLGLFGRITDRGRVMHLCLEDVDLTGVGAIGALAAFNSGTVHDCTSTGSVIGAGYDVGGLVGSNTGTITASRSGVHLLGYMRVGGLAGSNPRGIISNCRSTTVVLGSAGVGGLVGENAGSISASYSDSEVEGEISLGGLVGNNSGAVSSCYSMGNVTGSTYAGGLVGFNGGKISQCYSVAVVASRRVPTDMDIGGLVGRNVTGTGSAVRDSYFLAPADGGGPDNKIGTPLTAAQMRQQSSFAGWDFWGTVVNGTADRWFMPPDVPPVLAWQTEITGLKMVPAVAGLPLERARTTLTAVGFVPGSTSYDYDRALPTDFVIHAEPATVAAVGATIDLVLSMGTMYDWADNPADGTEANPYQIQTAGQLESLGDHPELWDRHFVLTADVDMAGRTYATALIAPDTSRVPDSLPSVAFTGVFDGQGHTIRRLTILADEREYVGLFGVVGLTGRVRDLNLHEATVNTATTGARATRSSPTTYVGILAGYNEGTIAGCSATESLLIGRTSGNGLVGTNRGSVVDCQADIVVVGGTSTTVTR